MNAMDQADIDEAKDDARDVSSSGPSIDRVSSSSGTSIDQAVSFITGPSIDPLASSSGQRVHRSDSDDRGASTR